MNTRRLSARITSCLDRWGTMLREHGAEPAMLVGQRDADGETFLCVPEGVTRGELGRFLRRLADLCEEEAGLT